MPNHSTTINSIVPEHRAHIRRWLATRYQYAPNGTAPDEPAEMRNRFSKNTIANTRLVRSQ